MTVDEATNLITLCAEKMNAQYESVVFDEWAVVCFAENRGYLLAYAGPRKEGFQKEFLRDAGRLRPSLFGRNHSPGDFEFTYDGIGTGFESFTVLGKGLYLIWNNTVQSLDGITRNPRWLVAQVPFVELSERLRVDPVVPTGNRSFDTAFVRSRGDNYRCSATA